MPLFRIRFTWKEKEYSLKARDLDMTHPYFVSIGDLIFPESNSLIIDPSDDDMRREFSDAKHIMIPFQQIQIIEELSETAESHEPTVIPFSREKRDEK